MDKEKRKNYEKPQMEIVRLRAKYQLLAGSGEGTLGDYETIDENNSNGWH